MQKDFVMESSQPEKKKIWVLEDEKDINWIYREVLAPKYDVDFFLNIHDFKMALETLPKPLLIISDLKLPDGNFIDFLKNNFSKVENIPYLVVSSDADIETLQFCLKEGAVDYLTKPFQINELLVKIERFLQLRNNNNTDKLKLLSESFINNNLTYKESKILSTLVQNFNNFVLRKIIIQNVWNNSEDVHPKTLDVHLYNLRRKVEPLGFQIYSDSAGRLKIT